MSIKKLFLFALGLILVGVGWIAYQTTVAKTLPSAAQVIPPEVNITVTASDMQFDPATIKVWSGQTVHLTFKNASATMVHEFKVNGLDMWTKAGPGLENTQTFLASPAGTYKFTCNIPGHEKMVGEFIVESAASHD